MLTIIITSYQEEKTIGKAIECLCNPDYSGYNKPIQLITVIPDTLTINVARATAKKFNLVKHLNIIDPKKGKPFALNLALEKASGEYILLSDGDVYFKTSSVRLLVDKLSEKEIGAVTGRPVSMDSKNSYMGYLGHLLADAAHHKRMVTMRSDAVGKSLKLVSKEPCFFVLSGYILAMRNFKLQVPNDTLIEDAYLSYVIHNKGYTLAYEPNAIVYVKYAQTINDWYKQKLRSVGGYMQLWKYGVIKETTKVRNFWKELEYFWFPIRYAQTLKQFIWSLYLYPIRLLLWIRIFWEQKIKKKDLIGQTGWERIESTK